MKGGSYTPADLFTKALGRQVFEQHRRTVLNVAGGDAVERHYKARLAAEGRKIKEREQASMDKIKAMLSHT